MLHACPLDQENSRELVKLAHVVLDVGYFAWSLVVPEELVRVYHCNQARALVQRRENFHLVQTLVGPYPRWSRHPHHTLRALPLASLAPRGPGGMSAYRGCML